MDVGWLSSSRAGSTGPGGPVPRINAKLLIPAGTLWSLRPVDRHRRVRAPTTHISSVFMCYDAHSVAYLYAVGITPTKPGSLTGNK